MNSQIPSFIQDDEDFDWDAAVLEIDAACQSTAAATTVDRLLVTPPQQQLPHVGPSTDVWNPKLNKQLNNCRQLTLDKFINNGVSTSKPRVEIDECDEHIRVPEKVCYVEIDPEAAKTWIYPDNVPRREYQLAISKTALFSNTLVALPTGLGKTLIAAVVMYNYFRWFPEGKIVFAAPSRPLVMQQIEACHNIVGIPQEWTIDMTGQTSPPKRASLWRSKRVFFVTPQVLEKDIQSGTCLVKHLVCLVIDEAHRAMGNYAYCVAVRELMAVSVQLRILALTATPGSKQQTIQQVIDNLQISALEYRSESDVDVCPYVHNRKIELFEVPMGKDATEINNLLSDAIRPIVTRLSMMGVLPNRDFQTLSPCDLLNSRDKFRQAPPPELPSMKYGEVEGYFGVLITLYHIRKLLSSHGIRPSHEMLEEKLRQGYFAKLMSRNEAVQKANYLMQKSVSHGAPSPKLSKMIDVLVDHFRNNDPKNSRVIIFSNFRGSVRDILDSLAKIGDLVKATQFIGQSSGKTLKGQTQKIQQAVLEKFRTGGYNVIVATSIGEEGLDIMEVDLVICFDANISPLRMIQRMGRTGRKHDGRVVVLACEGTEMKGYKRKLATSKTVMKHMQNGGMNSFNFHCSPRMVPHLYKPEVQFVELSIEKFVRQTKQAKNDSPQASSKSKKLTDAEVSLLNNYFQPSKAPCKLSLIAFPHFQAFPSGVHRVKHSARAGWLIDAMQHLQGHSSLTTSKPLNFDFSRSRCLTSGGNEQHNESETELLGPGIHTGSPADLFTSEVCGRGTSVDKEQQMLDSTNAVSKSTVPVPDISPQKKKSLPDAATQIGCKSHTVGEIQIPIDGELTETATDDVVILLTPPYEKNCSNVVPVTIDEMESESPAILPADKFDLDTSDLSPRLTSYIESGFVPESPLAEDISFNPKEADDEDSNSDAVRKKISFLHQSPVRCCVNSFASAKEDAIVAAAATPTGPQTRDITPSLAVDNKHTHLDGEAKHPSNTGGNAECLSMNNLRTPLRNLTNSSCSEDWRMSSGEKKGTQKSFKLKRLRKIGELDKKKQQHNVKKTRSCPSANLASTNAPLMVTKHSRVKRLFEDARDFIDVEAEVSSEDVVPDSEDEATYENSDAYEDSFIDDQVDATIGSTQAVDSKPDMMAIYRRSLLTQSPFQEQQKHSTVLSPTSVTSVTTIVESGDCTRTPQGCPNSNFSGRDSVRSRLRLVTPETIPSNSNSSLVNKASTDSRKRKLDSSIAPSLPAKNLENEFSSHFGCSSKEDKSSHLANEPDACWPGFSDDFYEGIDLDELEAQAAKLISQKSRPSMQSKRISEPSAENAPLLDAPSFDLGIL
ncbi:hypothetical protein RND81_01G212700 [Saponaria officinalis]|uniref:Fanconi anemia group M protein n=2 Tax=Saponaria officinalis TaxID=3572 RepID=A0AAW1N8X1_SAPOF